MSTTARTARLSSRSETRVGGFALTVAATPPPSGGAVIVDAVSCRGLLPADRNGLSDPFVVLALGVAKRKTKAVPETLDPVFDDTLVLPLPDALQVATPARRRMSVEVWDRDTASGADFLGEVELPLDQAFAEGWTTAVWRGALADPGGRLAASERKVSAPTRTTHMHSVLVHSETPWEVWVVTITIWRRQVLNERTAAGAETPCGTIELRLSFTAEAALAPEGASPPRAVRMNANR